MARGHAHGRLRSVLFLEDLLVGLCYEARRPRRGSAGWGDRGVGGGLVCSLLIYGLIPLPEPPTVPWAAVSRLLVWSGILNCLWGRECPALCFRDNHSLGGGEGGDLGLWGSLLLTFFYFLSPSLIVMWTVCVPYAAILFCRKRGTLGRKRDDDDDDDDG